MAPFRQPTMKPNKRAAMSAKSTLLWIHAPTIGSPPRSVNGIVGQVKTYWPDRN